jgi:hypothetical protein
VSQIVATKIDRLVLVELYIYDVTVNGLEECSNHLIVYTDDGFALQAADCTGFWVGTGLSPLLHVHTHTSMVFNYCLNRLHAA